MSNFYPIQHLDYLKSVCAETKFEKIRKKNNEKATMSAHISESPERQDIIILTYIQLHKPQHNKANPDLK